MHAKISWLSSAKSPYLTRRSLILSSLLERSVLRLSGNRNLYTTFRGLSSFSGLILSAISRLIWSFSHCWYLVLGKTQIFPLTYLAKWAFFLLGILPLIMIVADIIHFLEDKGSDGSRFEQGFSLPFLSSHKNGNTPYYLLPYGLPTRVALWNPQEWYYQDSVYTQGTFLWGGYEQTDNFLPPQPWLDAL